MQENTPRVQAIDRYSRMMADIRISRHPLRKHVLCIFTDKEYDIYQDSTTTESERLKKLAIVQKNPDLDYVQELDDVLMDDGDHIPWVVTMTLTGLPRTPRQDDYLIIEGVKYAISKVGPINRSVRGVVDCMIYPERTHSTDALHIYGVTIRNKTTVYPNLQESTIMPIDATEPQNSPVVVLDMVYGGNPIQQSIDGLKWAPFTSFIKYPVISEQDVVVYLRDRVPEFPDDVVETVQYTVPWS